MHFLKYNIPLAKIKSCLVTHSHSDHLYPQEIGMRKKGFSHINNKSPLTFYSDKSGCDMINAVKCEKNISDDEILKRATNYCLLSIDKYEEIESNLELAEAITLYNLINELRNIDKRKKIFDESTVTVNWLVHVKKFIERICTNG